MQRLFFQAIALSPKRLNPFSRSRRGKKLPPRSKFLIVCSCLLTVALTGCATTSFPVLGIRPDYPNFSPSQEAIDWCQSSTSEQRSACAIYRNYHEYAATLSASYRSRATLNEWGLYFAGLVGLSGLSATAGLAAANAGIQALRIVPLVTGFVSGTTAVVENKDKALNYTKAANKIDEAIDSANQMASAQDYTGAFVTLSRQVTKAKNDLELTKVELAARDKQIEEWVEKKINERLPKQLRLSDEDVKIVVDATLAVKVEDGASIDPARTVISKPALVSLSYSEGNQLITIKGRAIGQTSIKFRTQEGVGATLLVEVVGKTP